MNVIELLMYVKKLIAFHYSTLCVHLLIVKVESDYWISLERPDEVLQVWEIESPHNYENNQNTTQVLSS